MKNSLNKQLVNRMNRAVHFKDVEYWVARTENEMAAAQEMCEAHWSTGWLATLSRKGAATWFTAPAIFLALCYAFAFPKSVSVYFCYEVLLAGAVFAVFFEHLQFNPWNRVLKALSPIKGSPEKCHEALELVERYACVRQYRDRILAIGRQLRMVDFQVMQSLADGAQAEEAQRAKDLVCQKLHGLDTF